MKNTNRFVHVIAMLCLILIAAPSQAQNKNDLLFFQSLIKPENLAAKQMELHMDLSTLEQWRDKGARVVRIQAGKDAPGTFRSLYELDANGNIVHLEMSEAKIVKVADYDRQNRLKRITTSKGGESWSTQYFYYSRNGDLRKSVLKNSDNNKEVQSYYASNGRLERVRNFTKGIPTKTMNIEYVYDGDGRLTHINTPGAKSYFLYQGDEIVQFAAESVGASTRWNVEWKNGYLAELKEYENKDGDLILMSTQNIVYNKAGLWARKTVKNRDPKAEDVVMNMFYDRFDANTLAMRGDWDGGGYGYGTPVIVQWATPELDTRVTDSILPIRFDLKPGVGQEMPEIKSMTLRLNNKLTNKEIGRVVLQKKGVGNKFYVEDDLPLFEGNNTVYLEVETELGRFASGERFITYKNPKRQIKVADLHILAVGVSDYDVDALDLQHTNSDIESVVNSLTAQKGKLFGEVKTQVLSDKQATKANVEEAISKIRGKAAAEDLVLIYFAGQGEEYEGNFYLKPSDVKAERSELANTAIDNRWVLEEISRFNAPALYFLDAGHAVEDETVDVGSANLDEVKNDFEDVIDSDDDIRIFMSSTSSKQKAKISEDQSSMFAKALLEGISGKADVKGNNNGYVTIDELSEYVADRVLDMTSWSQKPSAVKRGIGLVPISKVSE